MLTTDQVLETLVKITGFPIGLFKETDSKTRISITVKTFFCDADIDEYNVLINGKDEIIEIKNSDFTWTKELIADLLSPRNQPQPTAVTQPSTVTTPTSPSQFTNMPSINPSQQIVDIAAIQQAIASFVTLNPGCVLSLFPPNTVPSEVPAQDPNAWELNNIEIDDNMQHYSMYCSNCTDTSIADLVTAELIYDTLSKSFINITVEG